MKQLTKSGCDWLKTAIDPFHDQELPGYCGYPDGDTENTVKVNVKTQATIRAPSGIGDNDVWDAHVCMFPLDAIIAGTDGVSAASGWISDTQQDDTGIDKVFPQVAPTTGATIPAGNPAGLSVRTALSGTAMWGTETPVVNLGPTNYVGNSKRGHYRVVAAGFEVVNSTADIYKQGDVTVYSVPTYYGVANACYEEASAYDPTTGKRTTNARRHVGAASTILIAKPPRTLAAAKQCSNARTWAASEGCYVPTPMHHDLHYSKLSAKNFVIYADSETTAPNAILNESFGPNVYRLEPDGTLVLSPGFGSFQNSAHFSDFDTSGAYFTGLSPQTSLTVTLRMKLELIPTGNDVQGLALATPTALPDMNAIELYQRIVNELPPAVPVDFNEAGKWFKMVRDIAMKSYGMVMPYLPAIETALAIAGRPVAAAALASAAQAAQRSSQSKKPSSQRSKNA